jgi:endonuclease G
LTLALFVAGISFGQQQSLPAAQPQPLWAELPVISPNAEELFVTHFVSADGERVAEVDEPGRVRSYTVCYDTLGRQPRWVACPMHPWYGGEAGRGDKWAFDPQIPREVQPDLRSAYKPVADNGSYSRGHLVASADRQRSEAMNRQTFYFTNMSPQTQHSFNGGIWKKLEERVREWAAVCPDTLYVVSGSAFIFEPVKITSDRAGAEIPVPTHFFKVLLSSKSGCSGRAVGELSADELRCVGFWLPHFGHGNKDRPSVDDMRSVAEIEELTGLSFFPMLSREAEWVKKSYNPEDWKGINDKWLMINGLHIIVARS